MPGGSDMRRSCLLVSLSLCLSLCCSNAHAKVEFEIVPGIGYLTGDTTYQIGNVPKEDDYVTPPREPYFPISELKYPLMQGIATVDAKLTVGRVVLSGGVRKNIADHTGHMRDYDWGLPYYDADGPDGPGYYVHGWTDGEHVWYDIDAESKSTTFMDAWMWEAGIAYRIFSVPYDYRYRELFTRKTERFAGTTEGYLGIGYERRQFDFECTLIRQWSPTGHNEEYFHEGDGSVAVTYDVNYSIPYIEFTLANRTDRLDVEMDFGVSPLVHVDDEDVHLHRIPGPIYSEGHLSGNALKYAFRIRYNLTSRWFVAGLWDYLFIRANGTQHQNIYAGSYSGTDSDGTPYTSTWQSSTYAIEEKVSTHESFFTVNVGCRLGN